MGNLTTSVAMATYNGEAYILEQLESILFQTRSLDEVVISDDGSTDSTIEIIQNFISKNQLKNWTLYHNLENSGVSRNFYNAMSRVTGDIVFLADQDDIWKPNKVERMALLFEKKHDVESVISSISYLGDKSNQLIKIRTALSNNRSHLVSYPELLSVCSYLGMSAAFRKSVFDDINLELWNKTSHDWTLFITAIQRGKVEFLGEPLQLYRIHANNASKISGETFKEKRLSLIDRQLQTILETNRILDQNEKKSQYCLSYSEFLKKRKKFIVEKKVISLLLHFTTYLKLGYLFRSFIADLLSSVKE